METDCVNFRAGQLNISARTQKDHISVLSLDDPGKDGFYGLHTLTIPTTYRGATGGQDIDLHGMDVEVLPDNRLRFWLINHRPPIDVEGRLMNATKFGANSTVEVFEMERGAKSLEFVKTIASNVIVTPNGIAATGDGGFVITNDHAAKGKISFSPTSNVTRLTKHGYLVGTVSIIKHRYALAPPISRN